MGSNRKARTLLVPGFGVFRKARTLPLTGTMCLPQSTDVTRTRFWCLPQSTDTTTYRYDVSSAKHGRNHLPVRCVFRKARTQPLTGTMCLPQSTDVTRTRFWCLPQSTDATTYRYDVSSAKHGRYPYQVRRSAVIKELIDHGLQ